MAEGKIDKEFLEYIDNAIKKFEDYKKLEKSREFTLHEFLMLILIWKVEGIYETLEQMKEAI